MPVDVADALAGAAAAIDEAQGPGAKDILLRVTVNIGVIHGGLKVNIVPGTCWFEADVRVPPGLDRETVLAKVRQILAACFAMAGDATRAAEHAQRVLKKKADFSVADCCRALRVSTSGFYAWRHRPESARARRDRHLRVRIRASHEAAHRHYGRPRIWKDLREEGERVSEKRVARLMRSEELRARPRKRFRSTTMSEHDQPVAANVLARQFDAERQALDELANADNACFLALVQRQVRINAIGRVQEKLHRRELLGPGAYIGPRHFHTRQLVGPLFVKIKPLARGDDELEPRRVRQQIGDNTGALHQVFEVVEDQQHLFVVEVAPELVGRRLRAARPSTRP